MAVRLLTAREKQLKQATDRGLAAATEGGSDHLCVSGAYGYGKSHSLTYIHERALAKGFVASMIQLDPRETPFHDFRQVYRALFANLRFPDGPESFSGRWRAFAKDSKGRLDEMLPKGMPFFFRAALLALAGRTIDHAERQTTIPLRPHSFRAFLERALSGEAVPLSVYRSVVRLRQVPIPSQATLRVKGSGPFLEMVQALSMLLGRMGYRGLVLLFDEGESILHARLQQRSRSYAALDYFFRLSSQAPRLFSVFAFTEDFFRAVESEEYTRAQPGQGLPYFAHSYREVWKKLNIYRLDALSGSDWEELLGRLAALHSQAYNWEPPARTREEMLSCVNTLGEQETRIKLKILIDRLDILHQTVLFAPA